MKLFAVVVLVVCCGTVCADVNTIKIGAIFDTPGDYKKTAFEVAIDQLNAIYSATHFKVEPVIEHLTADDPLEAMAATCSLMHQGVVGILGPSLDHNSRTVQSICDDKDVPHLDVRWVDEPGTPIINFYPSQDLLTQLYIDIVNRWEYKNFLILYENDNSLRRITRFLEQYDRKDYKLVLRQLDKSGVGDYRPVLKQVKKSGAKYLIIDCSVEILKDVLIHAQQVGIMTEKHSYFITNLDLQSLDLEPFQYSGTNITGIRIFNPRIEEMEDLAQMIFRNEIEENPLFGLEAPYKLQLETLLVVDAVMMFGEVLSELEDLQPKSMDCERNDHWSLGSTITNLVKGVITKNGNLMLKKVFNSLKQYFGLTGGITFDVKGYRNNFIVDIFELKEGGITKIGNWTDRKKLAINRTYEPEKEDGRSLRHENFRVLISLIEPFARFKKQDDSAPESETYEGYAIDLIHELSLIEGFNYTFINQYDKQNGEYNKTTKSWNGMIGEIIAERAELAIADLTITTQRQIAVDFTTPFMNLGISILYQKPKKSSPGFFSFADPFALEVWIFVAVSYFTVAIVLFILGRICSSEWINPYPCIEEPEFLENQLSLRNCFWFVSGSIMQQGTDIGPLALSTRMLAGVWWFFTLIMVSSYTANLAAFLTRETPVSHFTNVQGLVQNAEAKGIKWGAKSGGSTVTFFNASRDRFPEYGVIYDRMIKNADDLLVKDPKFGVERAEKENYAFFMEITSIEFEIQRRCNLMRVGPLLDEKSYGIAMKKNSTYRNVLSRAILDLQHSGKLNELKRKWWEENQGGGFCESGGEAEATPLNLKNVGGVFWVTIGGTLLAIGLVVAELVLHVIKISFQTKKPIRPSLREEFTFYFKFSGRVKPVTRSNGNSEVVSKKSSENKS